MREYGVAEGRKRSFLPVCDEGCDRLILGSLPGEESLRKGQYYAFPANHFWRLVYEVYNSVPEAEYDARLRFLLNRGIGLWDVIKSARREGSLDQRIKEEEPNDFTALFARYPGIETLFFNGAKARDAFLKWFPGEAERRRCVLLPSSSPIPGRNRAYSDKLSAWMAISKA